MKDPKLFKVVRCPKCGQIQATQASALGFLKCVYCGKRTKMRTKGRWAVTMLFETDSQYATMLVCSELKMQEGKAVTKGNHPI